MSTVKKSVTGLDGIVDLAWRGLWRDFPQAKAYQRHVVAIVELNGRWSHHFARCSRVLRGAGISKDSDGMRNFCKIQCK